MFLELGEKLGVIFHIVSCWRYRFPRGATASIDAEELSATSPDFSSSFGEKVDEGTLIRHPAVLGSAAA
ncbi:MAG: hypothetical protein RL274_593 [Pseudomonadota bacterium]|jgi:hypothetical protein